MGGNALFSHLANALVIIENVHLCQLNILQMANTRKAALGFIFVTLLIDTTGFGHHSGDAKLIQQLIHGISAGIEIGGWLGFAYAAMQFLFALFWET